MEGPGPAVSSGPLSAGDNRGRLPEAEAPSGEDQREPRRHVDDHPGEPSLVPWNSAADPLAAHVSGLNSIAAVLEASKERNARMQAERALGRWTEIAVESQRRATRLEAELQRKDTALRQLEARCKQLEEHLRIIHGLSAASALPPSPERRDEDPDRVGQRMYAIEFAQAGLGGSGEDLGRLEFGMSAGDFAQAGPGGSGADLPRLNQVAALEAAAGGARTGHVFESATGAGVRARQEADEGMDDDNTVEEGAVVDEYEGARRRRDEAEQLRKEEFWKMLYSPFLQATSIPKLGSYYFDDSRRPGVPSIEQHEQNTRRYRNQPGGGRGGWLRERRNQLAPRMAIMKAARLLADRLSASPLTVCSRLQRLKLEEGLSIKRFSERLRCLVDQRLPESERTAALEALVDRLSSIP